MINVGLMWSTAPCTLQHGAGWGRLRLASVRYCLGAAGADRMCCALCKPCTRRPARLHLLLPLRACCTTTPACLSPHAQPTWQSGGRSSRNQGCCWICGAQEVGRAGSPIGIACTGLLVWWMPWWLVAVTAHGTAAMCMARQPRIHQLRSLASPSPTAAPAAG